MKIHRAVKREKEQAAGSRGSGEGKAPRADEALRDPPAGAVRRLQNPCQRRHCGGIGAAAGTVGENQGCGPENG